LARLEKRLEKAAAGQGGALALIGETGIGKSHLVAALAGRARRRGMAVLTCRCLPFAQTTPYFPWSELVGQWFQLDENEDEDEEVPPETRRQRLRERLAQFDLSLSFPAFADLLGLLPVHLTFRLPQAQAQPFGVTSQGDLQAEPEAGLFAALKQRVESRPADNQHLGTLLTERMAQVKHPQAEDDSPSLWSILRERASIPRALRLALERQARRQPTLVVIEDLQWMDPDSREILEAVVGGAPAWPLLLLVTARPETDWAGDRLPLPPLSEAEGQALAASELRATRLEPELAGWLLARGGGNPLFIASYCQTLRDADAVVIDPASGEARWSGPPPPLPLSLQELLLARVNRLDRETQEVMRRGAVIGVTFPTWLLTHLCHDVLSPTHLNRALDQAARRLLIAPPPPAQAHTFSSQSLHEAIYVTLSHAQRRAWHERVGSHLAQAAGECNEATRYERLEQIAYHYSRSDDPHEAARFTRLAGDKARARQANEAALTFYTQTLAMIDGNAVATERWQAHEGIGDVHALWGASEAAHTAYQAALRDGALGDRELHPGLVEGERRLKAKLALLTPLVGPADGSTEVSPVSLRREPSGERSVEPLAEVSALLEEAWQALSPSDPLRPWMGAARAWFHAGCGEAETAITLCRDLLPTAREPVGTLLREALESLEKGEPLSTYADFFALFADSCLRLPPAEQQQFYPLPLSPNTSFSTAKK